MDDYQIQPWGDAEGDVQSVPPEMERLAEDVISRYDMTVTAKDLITTKPDKGGAIWRIDTNRGPRSLKVLHRTPARSLFSVGAQDYLVKQGARVPPLVPTRTGELSTEAGGKLWIVTDWIEPLVPVSKIDLEGAQALCYGLGEFHRISQGYVPPEGAEKASRLYQYPKQYQKMLTKMDWFRVIAHTYHDMPASARLCAMIDKYEQQARDALHSLQQSAYSELTARGEPAWGIAHQDYGWSNGQMGEGGIWIIDLDGVSYDLPIRDLRKVITSTMDDMGVWDVAWMRGMIEAYHQANPIEPELYQVLLIDMALPNEFYKLVKEMVFTPELFLDHELDALLDRLERTDATKWPALAELGATILSAPVADKPAYARYEAPPAPPAGAKRPTAAVPVDRSEKSAPPAKNTSRANEPAATHGRDKARETVRDTARDTASNTARDSIRDTAGNTARNTAGNSARDTARDTARDATRDIAPNPARTRTPRPANALSTHDMQRFDPQRANTYQRPQRRTTSQPAPTSTRLTPSTQSLPNRPASRQPQPQSQPAPRPQLNTPQETRAYIEQQARARVEHLLKGLQGTQKSLPAPRKSVQTPQNTTSRKPAQTAAPNPAPTLFNSLTSKVPQLPQRQNLIREATRSLVQFSLNRKGRK
jgi:CotS family spore coat protein